jgi:hypothetical protein
MKTCIGVWLDHHKAVIVSIGRAESEQDENPTSITRIESGVMRRVRPYGGSRTRKTPYGPQEAVAEGKIEKRYNQQLRRYYRKIIEAVRYGDKFIILGPGESKIELQKEVEADKSLAVRLVGTETADKMTDHQIVAWIKKYFNIS